MSEVTVNVRVPQKNTSASLTMQKTDPVVLAKADITLFPSAVFDAAAAVGKALSAADACADDAELGSLADGNTVTLVAMVAKRPSPDPAAEVTDAAQAAQAGGGDAVSELVAFLASLDLVDMILPRFMAEGITSLADVRRLSNDDYKDLGVPMGPRNKITHALADLK